MAMAVAFMSGRSAIKTNDRLSYANAGGWFGSSPAPARAAFKRI
jgi:hypothetical protein